MLLILLGAGLVVGGVLLTAAKAMGQGPLSSARRSRSAGVTLEPRTTGGGFSLKANWPGLVLIALGVVLLLIGAVF